MPSERQQPYAGGQRAVAEDELQVLREVVDRAERREEEQHDGEVRAGEGAVGEPADVQDRPGMAQFPRDEPGQARAGQHGRGHRARAPAEPRPLDDHVHERPEEQDRQQPAHEVQPAAYVGAGRRDERERGDHRDHGHRHVDQKGRPPRVRL